MYLFVTLDLTEEIRGDKMRFLESMQKATTVNVMCECSHRRELCCRLTTAYSTHRRIQEIIERRSQQVDE